MTELSTTERGTTDRDLTDHDDSVQVALEFYLDSRMRPEYFTVLTGAGWTPVEVARLYALAQQTTAAGAWRAWFADKATDPAWIASRLLTVALRSPIPAGCSIPETFAWLSVLADSPTFGEYVRVQGVIDPPLVADADPIDLPVRAWRPLDRWGPLALTAGLTLDEAQAQYVTGTLEEGTLRTMAALRGWQRP